MLRVLKALSFLLSRLPMGLLVFSGEAVGSLIYALDRKHRERVIDNLNLAYGESIYPERKREIARGVFRNLTVTFLEFLRLPWLKKEDLEGYVDCDGLENLKKALSKKKGAIILTGHFGNWELMGVYYGLIGYRLDIVARELDSPLLEEFVTWVRTGGGNRVVSKRKAMRRLIRTLNSNGIAGILLDQNVTSREGYFVDFFGTPACTNKGPALLISSTGTPVLPSFIVRDGRRHRLMIGPEVELVSTGDREADAQENTKRCTGVIEDMIRRYPDQWFWVHRRWKTRPGQA